jgi:lipase chaperone LimK
VQENLQEYVAKKREIFFVQMSLDTKRAEIRKLEERIFQREEVPL